MMSAFDLDKLTNATMDISVSVNHSYWGKDASTLPSTVTHELFSDELKKTYHEKVTEFVCGNEDYLNEFLDIYGTDKDDAEWFIADCLAWSCFHGGEGFNMNSMDPICEDLMTAALNADLPDPAHLDWHSMGEADLDGKVVLMSTEKFFDQ